MDVIDFIMISAVTCFCFLAAIPLMIILQDDLQDWYFSPRRIKRHVAKLPMKARTIRRLRKQIMSEGYIAQRLVIYISRCNEWQEYFDKIDSDHIECDLLADKLRWSRIDAKKYGYYVKIAIAKDKLSDNNRKLD